MIRAAISLIAGCLLGAVVVYAVVGQSERSGPASFAEAVAELASGRASGREPSVASVSESLATYRAAAAEADPANLEAALRAAAASPRSAERDVEIDALLARLGEIAPAAATAAARALGLETRFLADAYVYLAAADPAAAIRELASIESRVQRLDVALALLDVVGNDNAGLERVAAGLQDADRARLRIGWIAARAEYDPYGAFREAQSLGESDAAIALAQIGAAWAAQDPSSAIVQADLLAEPSKSRYLASVVGEWARLDANGYLAWLESIPSPSPQEALGLQFVAATNPDLVIAVAGELPGNAGRMARVFAVQAFAENDAEAAMARVRGMEAGPERESLLMAIGSVLARRDPDAALAFARSVSVPPEGLLPQIMFTIAQTDPDRAIELLDDPPPGVDPRLAISIATSMMVRDAEAARTLADNLVARDSIQSANALQNLVGSWMRTDPERALEWVLAHESQINASVLSTAAQGMAGVDPVAAAGYLDRIPLEHRSAWIRQVAGPYGLSDPSGALAWVAQFQGQAVYDHALRAVITGASELDARLAAEAVSQASPAVQIGVAPQVAARFAQQDPLAAARWAQSLTNDGARNNAIGMAVSSWAITDLSGAQSYALGLDRGETRDQALSMLVMRSTQAGDLDPRLLNAFSSDRALQDALASAIPAVARRDPDRARALLERITSGETRRMIEAQIESQSEQRPGQAVSLGSAGGIRMFESNQ